MIGRVVDATGQPLAGATVTTVDDLVATSGSDGRFSISHVPTTRGDIIVVARATVNNQPLEGHSEPLPPVFGGVTDVGDVKVTLTRFWDGGANTREWLDAANWNDDTLPGPTENVYIPVTATVDLSAGAVTVRSISSDGDLNLRGGTLSLAEASQVRGNFALFTGALDGAGVLTVTQTMTWTGGSLTGSGRTVVLGDLVMGGSGTMILDRVLENRGSGVWQATAGGLRFSTNSLLRNAGGATLELASDQPFSIWSWSDTGVHFENLGLVRKSAPLTLTVDVGFANAAPWNSRLAGCTSPTAGPAAGSSQARRARSWSSAATTRWGQAAWSTRPAAWPSWVAPAW